MKVLVFAKKKLLISVQTDEKIAKIYTKFCFRWILDHKFCEIHCKYTVLEVSMIQSFENLSVHENLERL